LQCNHQIAIFAFRAPQGLYHPRNEHERLRQWGWSPAFAAKRAMTLSARVLRCSSTSPIAERRVCDPETGDGAGILIQIPHVLFRARVRRTGNAVAGAGRLWRGHVLSARGQAQPAAVQGVIERIAQEEGLTGELAGADTR